MIQNFLLLILVTSPLILAAVITVITSSSLLSVLMVLIGAIAGAILMPFSGIIWLQTLHSTWIQSQAAGFIFVPIILPFFAYTGAISGANFVVFLYSDSNSLMLGIGFQVMASFLTLVIGGLIPATSATIPYFAQFINSITTQVQGFVALPIFAICIGLVASWSAIQLAYFLAPTVF